MLFGNPARLSPAISPDGRQLAWIAPDEDVLNVWVRDLDGAPGRLASLLWTRYRREYLYALEEHLGGLRDDGYERPEERIYWERLEQLVARGASDRGEVRVQSRALVSWEFEIDDDVLRTLTEAEFLAALRAATTGLLADYRARLTLLTDDVLGLGLPSWFRADAVQGARNV